MIKESSSSYSANFNSKQATLCPLPLIKSSGCASKMYLPKVIPYNTIRADTSMKNHLFRIDSTSIISSYQTFRKLQMDVQNIEVGCKNYHLRCYNTPMIEDYSNVKPFATTSVNPHTERVFDKETLIANEIRRNNSQNSFLVYKSVSKLNHDLKQNKSASKLDVYSTLISNNSKNHSDDNDEQIFESSQIHSTSRITSKRKFHNFANNENSSPPKVYQKSLLSRNKEVSASTIKFKILEDKLEKPHFQDRRLLIKSKNKGLLHHLLHQKKEFESKLLKYIKIV